jgi:hypothetical protein
MRPDQFWDDDAILKDLLFTTNMSIAQIAKELDWTQSKTSQRIKQLGLSWVKRNNRKLSRGHAALVTIMQKLLPGEEIVLEHHVGERLMLDIFCPGFNLGAEYHGRQHFFYSNLFHKDKQDFIDGQKRDERKIELCEQKGIALVVFKFSDKLTEDFVFRKLLDAINNSKPIVKEKASSVKGDPYYEEVKRRNSEYRKKKYKELKEKYKSGRRP